MGFRIWQDLVAWKRQKKKKKDKPEMKSNLRKFLTLIILMAFFFIMFRSLLNMLVSIYQIVFQWLTDSVSKIFNSLCKVFWKFFSPLSCMWLWSLHWTVQHVLFDWESKKSKLWFSEIHLCLEKRKTAMIGSYMIQNFNTVWIILSTLTDEINSLG